MNIEKYIVDFALFGEVIHDEKDEVIFELVKTALTSTSSGEWREIPICIVQGKSHSKTKLGYDVYGESVEIKSKSILTNTTCKSTSKHNGLGKFSDFSWKRHLKYLNDDAVIFVGGYVDGRLLFIVEFPYSSISEFMEKKLLNKFPNRDSIPNGKIKSGSYSSLDFSWLTYKDAYFSVPFLSEQIERFRPHFVAGFYDLLVKNR